MASGPQGPDLPSPPQNIDQADAIADKWEREDPFVDLSPSLLTAEQIFNYQSVASLIYPFDERMIKGATYEVGIGGQAYYWDDKRRRRVPCVRNEGGLGIVLQPNSITFVETDVDFLLPQYIALRFNLHIKLVHRGLLLGTGPIVDPGFRGKLLIPLHNLTDSPYTIKRGEKIVWVEFTKTLYGQKSSDPKYVAKDKNYRVFPPDKRRLSSEEYLWRANANNPIMSSVSGFISTTDERIKEAEKKVNNIALAGLISLAIGFTGAIWGSWSVYNNALGVVRADENRRAQLEARVRHLEECTAHQNNAGTDSLGNACVALTPPPSSTPQ